MRLLPLTEPSLFPIIKLLAFIGSDTSILYNADSEKRFSDLIDNPASDYYQKPPLNKMLGDLGELTVFNMLIDPDGEDKLTEQEIEDIQIKTDLSSTITADKQKPDFYIPSRNLVVDSKAWKELGSNKLNDVIKKYVNLECLSQGGELRLYFPSDTYEQQQTLIAKLPTQVEAVRVRTMPMEVTHKDLTAKRGLILTFLKSFMVRTSPKK